MTDNPNSALYWLPLLEQAGLSGLPTLFVPYDHQATVYAMEATDATAIPGWETLILDVWKACVKVGLPAFVRTDQASAKHDGPRSYRVDVEDDVRRVLSFTVQDNEMKFWPFGPYPSAFMVRAWLDLAAPFTAFGGHRVAREWRYFAAPDGVRCRHFYWPHEAIIDADDDTWPVLLEVLSAQEPPPGLALAAVRAANVLTASPEWSIDFAEDADGAWWLIDCATAETSWHPEDCPNAGPT
jgi:hypothetical protein